MIIYDNFNQRMKNIILPHNVGKCQYICFRQRKEHSVSCNEMHINVNIIDKVTRIKFLGVFPSHAISDISYDVDRIMFFVYN